MNSSCLVIFINSEKILTIEFFLGKPSAYDWDRTYIDLTWSKPLSDGGSAIDGYIIQMRQKGTSGVPSTNQLTFGSGEPMYSTSIVKLLPALTLTSVRGVKILGAWYLGLAWIGSLGSPGGDCPATLKAMILN